MKIMRPSIAVSLAFGMATGLASAQTASPTCPPVAQQPTPAQMQELVKNARDHGFLWKATKGGKTSYLYGTIHIGKPEWMFPGTTTLQAVKASDAIALEMDVLDPDIAQRLQAGMTSKGTSPLPDALIARLKVQMKAACLPESLLTVMPPEMLSVTLTSLAGRKDGLDPAFAVDPVYAGLGRGLKKSVKSLETPEAQLKLITGETPEEMRESVDSALQELEKGTASPMLKRMAQAWADGRIKELETYEEWCDCVKTAKDRESMRKLLDERNPGLAKGIDAIHSAGTPVFAAVGSLHMVGKTGLPALLTKRGYVVERIEFKP